MTGELCGVGRGGGKGGDSDLGLLGDEVKADAWRYEFGRRGEAGGEKGICLSSSTSSSSGSLLSESSSESIAKRTVLR